MITTLHRSSQNRRIRHLASAYLTAKERVIEWGFAREIDWQHALSFDNVTESSFLRETAWVILSAGMRESVIRSKFPAISAAFHNWISASQIMNSKQECRGKALAVFANERKIDSIIKVAEEVNDRRFSEVRRLLEEAGILYILQLPFMGPATAFHLAKNIGLPVVKPDRHLVRVAQTTGYSSPKAMCKEIAKVVGDKIAVVDLVIWRYATLDRNYLGLFSA